MKIFPDLSIRFCLLLSLCSLCVGCITLAKPQSSAGEERQFERTLGVIATDAVTLQPEEALEAVQSEHAYWAEVVDSKGNPLPGVPVQLTVFDHLIQPFRYPYFGFTRLSEKTTNRFGRIHVRSFRGAALQVHIINDSFKVQDGARRFYAYHPALAQVQTHEAPTRDNPARFILQPRTGVDELEQVSSGAIQIHSGEPRFLALPELNPYGVSKDQANLRVLCNMEDKDSATLPFAWSCSLISLGGGLQEIAQMDDAIAPETNYVTQLNVSSSGEGAQWQSRDERALFFRTADGRYGRLNWGIRVTGDRYVFFEGVLNSVGERFLE